MMKVAVILVFLSLSLYVAAQRPPTPQPPGVDFITAYAERYSWETIVANNTSYMNEIDAHRGRIYVAGEGYVHEILEEPFEFSLDRYYFHQGHHRYIDFKVFEHRNESYIFGPVEARYHHDFRAARKAGISHPIQIGSFTDRDQHVFDFSIQIAAVDATDMGDHAVVYGAGWVLGDFNCSNHMWVGFGIFRMFVHPGHISNHNGTFISMRNHTNDIILLPEFSGYTEYHRDFKPWIFHSYHTEQIIVVDPASDMIHRIHAPNRWDEGMKHLGSSSNFFAGTNITSATFDAHSSTLVIGTRGHGFESGGIIAINVSEPAIPTRENPFTILFARSLNRYESNPKALALRGDSLYVGFTGGSYVAHLSMSQKGLPARYATVPHYAQNVHDIHASHRHLYIVTNEQFSKIARTTYHHFCDTPCDSFYGYCNNGTCACKPGYQLNTTNHWAGHCSPIPIVNTEVKEETVTIFKGHAGEVVLGLLFALFFVIAVVGWFIVWRNATGKSVPFGLGKSGRYSALNGEERESFLAE